VVDLDNARELPQAPAGTTVVRRDRDVEVLPGGSGASLLAVDPDRFGDVAFWTPELADTPFETLLAALETYDGTRVPVIVAGPLPAAVVSATSGELTIDSPKYQIPVQVVGRADAWPGMSSTKPLLIAPQQALATALLDAEREIALVTTAQAWGRGSPDQVLASLGKAGFGVPREEQVRTAAAFQDRPELRAQQWTLGYLRAVAAVAALLGLVGLGLHAASQQRRRTVATVLLTRMGLTPRSARRSAAAELVMIGGIAAVLGAALTLPAAQLLLGRLDPLPSLPPGPLFAVPGPTLAALAFGVVVAAVAGAALVDRMARRIPGGEVLRGGE
jgi:putative ABC transport system permease protein